MGALLRGMCKSATVNKALGSFGRKTQFQGFLRGRRACRLHVVCLFVYTGWMQAAARGETVQSAPSSIRVELSTERKHLSFWGKEQHSFTTDKSNRWKLTLHPLVDINKLNSGLVPYASKSDLMVNCGKKMHVWFYWSWTLGCFGKGCMVPHVSWDWHHTLHPLLRCSVQSIFSFSSQLIIKWRNVMLNQS